MRTLSNKINCEASRIAHEYIKTLADGNEPATLAAIIQLTRYGILANIGDGRVNASDTLEKVKIQAHLYIKIDLGQNPELAQRLIEFRAARTARDNQAVTADQIA